jgi:hypothetical protein
MVAAGLCQAIVKGVRTKNAVIREKLLRMVSIFIIVLPPDTKQAAVTLLVAGDAVELAVGHLLETGLPSVYLMDLLFLSADKPQARERLSSKRVADQLVHWVAQCLVQVRNIVVKKEELRR